MFKEIFSVLRKEDLLKQALDQAYEMFSKSEMMFKVAIDMIMQHKKPDIDIYERDKEINKMEWEIRKKVLEHLIVSDKKQDAAAVLILTSAVIDMERIGDYSKNIFEIADICPGDNVVDEAHTEFFSDIEAQIFEIFRLTRESYMESDAEKAQSAMAMHWSISERCDEMFEKLALEKGLKAEYAVIYTLLARYLKRVSSHLKNIASSVANPFPRMGFRTDKDDRNSDVG